MAGTGGSLCRSGQAGGNRGGRFHGISGRVGRKLAALDTNGRKAGTTIEKIPQLISDGVTALSQELSPASIEMLAKLLAELTRWNARINLTAIRDPEAMVSGHILDSLVVRPMLAGRRVLDVGTGAGFPGLPLAIAEPEMEFVLLDSNGKKISFVRHIIGELELSNVVAIKVRAEDYAPAERFDTVIARALASIPKLLGLAGQLVSEKGVLLALKGQHPADELEPTKELFGWKYEVIDVTVPGLESHSRHVVRLRRTNTA